MKIQELKSTPEVTIREQIESVVNDTNSQSKHLMSTSTTSTTSTATSKNPLNEAVDAIFVDNVANVANVAVPREEEKKDKKLVPIDQITIVDGKPLNFNIKLLPPTLRNFTEEVSEKIQVQRSHLATAILSVISVSIGKNYTISDNSLRNERANLYSCIVGKSSTRKSPALKFALAPIAEYTKLEFEKLNIDESYSPQQLTVNDFTFESLTDVLKDSSGSMVVADELKSWFNNMNRYNSGSDVEKYLSIYNNESITINRKKGDEKLSYIEDPFLNIIGGIQDELLKTFADKKQNANGLVNRFLFALTSENFKYKRSSTRVDESVLKEYRDLIFDLLNFRDKHQGVDYETSPDDNDILDFISDQYSTYSISDDPTASYKGKMYSQFLKIALILQVVNDRHKKQTYKSKFIDRQILKDAYTISLYYWQSYLHAMGLVNKDQSVFESDAEIELYESLKDEFTTKEFTGNCMRIFRINKRNSANKINTWVDRKLIKRKVKKGEFYKVVE